MKLTQLYEQKTEYKIFCDLDGVLVNFMEGINKLYMEVHNEEYDDAPYIAGDKKHAEKMWNTLNKYMEDGNEFWYDLNKMSDADQLWKYIAPHNPSILTATGKDMHGSGVQKKRWVKDNIDPNVRVDVVESGHEKGKMAQPNFILIDDMKKSIDPWIAAGGIGILHTSASDTIAQLKKLGI